MSIRSCLAGVSIAGALLLAGFLVWNSGQWQTVGRERAVAPVPDLASIPRAGASAAIPPHVAAFCGDCHSVPHPDTFPRAAWEDEVERGYKFYLDADRQDLVMPAKAEVVSYYRAQSPESLVLPEQPVDPSESSPRFVRELASPTIVAPAVSHVDWSPIDRDLIACDMRSGAVDRCRLSPSGFSIERLATTGNLAHVVRCDLDSDGRIDLVAADLGSFHTLDHDRGRVLWLRQTETGGYEEQVILAGVGRVADVQPGDFDGDGDLDLVVAEFGLHKTGGIHLLENRGTGAGAERFMPRRIDRRHGASHIPVVDLNQDGRPDFMALISQEHEVVDAFLNAGDREFRRQTLYAAGDPSFGSSGLLPVDLDQDGDLDIVLSNGDTFDSFHLKPYHGLRWLENRGSGPFVEHHLLSMPGIHRAVAADLDGDGDLDLACVSFIPHRLAAEVEKRRLDSVVWLEQTAAHQFVRHVIERSACHQVTLVAGDFDDDGDIDLITGNFDTSPGRELPALIWWRNTGAR